MILVGAAAVVIALYFISVLRLFLSRFIDRPFPDTLQFIRRDDAGTLAELLDASTDKRLREILNHAQFRREQLRRIRLAQERIECRSHNATVWQEWADTELARARIAANEEICSAAQDLVAACVEFRIGACAVMTQLRVWQLKLWLLPFASVPRVSRLRKTQSFDLLDSYDCIKASALRLAEACGGDCYMRLREAF